MAEGNRLSQFSDRMSVFLRERVREEVRQAGYIFIVFDRRNFTDYTISDNFSTPELTRAQVLESVTAAEQGRKVSPIIDPNMFDPTGGVLPRNGVRSLPSGIVPLVLPGLKVG